MRRSPGPPAGPPSWLERIVERLLGAGASTPYIVGDLREEFRAVRVRSSAPLAALWFLVHGIRVAIRVRLERRRPGPAIPGRAHTRSARLGDIMTTDLRQSLRFLLRRPVLSCAVVLTVALAVAATTAVFAVVDGVLLEPLPYSAPERLVAVWESNPGGEDRNVVSPANFLAWRDDLESLDAMASILETSTTLIVDGVPERVGWVQASADWFEMSGAQAVLGRLYDEAEDQPGGESVVVLSEDFWRRRFGADPDVVGRTVQLGLRPGGVPFTILGVLADRYDLEIEKAAFGSVGRHDIWIPPQFAPEAREAGGRYLQVVARLAPGVGLSAARQESAAMAERLAETFPERQRGWGVQLVPLHDDLVGDVRATLIVVFGAVCFVLLIACANVANLLMTRASEREREMAVRSAIGARWGRLVRQLIGESAILSAVGGALGVVLAHWAVTALVRSAPELPRLETVSVDATVLIFAMLATCGTALLFGIAPAVSLGRPDVAGSLGARGGAARRGTRRVRDALVVVQVAFSLVLLVGAGLLVRSLVNRLEVGVGFQVEGVLTTDVQLGGAGYGENEQAPFFEELVERVGGLPGVLEASAITGVPLMGGGSRTSFWPLDRPVPEAGQLPGADVRWVHRDYHDVLGIPLVRGRTFQESDRPDAPLVVLVNETGAARTWPGESALGKRIAMPWSDTLVAEVVGVVGDIRHRGPDTEPYPMFYWDHRQFHPSNVMSLVVRTREEARTSVVTGIQGQLAEMNPGIPLYNVHPMAELYADTLQRSRLATLTLGLFALVALVLAGIGVYGVVSHATARRTREIGIRMALGAGRPTILGLVLREGMGAVVLALALGTLGAVAVSRLLEGLVFGVSTVDPVTFIVTASLLGTIGFVATWLPARRASGTDPAETIRLE